MLCSSGQIHISNRFIWFSFLAEYPAPSPLLSIALQSLDFFVERHPVHLRHKIEMQQIDREMEKFKSSHGLVPPVFSFPLSQFMVLFHSHSSSVFIIHNHLFSSFVYFGI